MTFQTHQFGSWGINITYSGLQIPKKNIVFKICLNLSDECQLLNTLHGCLAGHHLDTRICFCVKESYDHTTSLTKTIHLLAIFHEKWMFMRIDHIIIFDFGLELVYCILWLLVQSIHKLDLLELGYNNFLFYSSCKFVLHRSFQKMIELTNYVNQ